MATDVKIVGRTLRVPQELLDMAPGTTVSVSKGEDPLDQNMTITGPRGRRTVVWHALREDYVDALKRAIQLYAEEVSQPNSKK